MKIVLIAYSFPPFHDAQSIRWYYLANSLAELGAKIDVITIDHPAREYDFFSFHKNINVYRIFPGLFEFIALKTKKGMGVDDEENRKIRKLLKFRILKFIYWSIRNLIGNLLPGDIRTEWFPLAVRHIEKKINFMNYDFMISSHEPWVDSLLGLYFKKKYNVKWIADFGDPYVASYIPKHKLWFEKRFEESIYKNADMLIFTNSSVVESLKDKYPFLKNKKILIVEQGFSYKSYPWELSPIVDNKNRVFRLTYTGTLYKNIREPFNFIKALSMLDFEYKFLLAGRNEQFIEDFSVLGDKFKFLGFINHFDVLKLQNNSNVLIHLANKYPTQIPGKFYEYLKSLKPILHISNHDGEPTAEIVKKMKCGMCCKDNPDAIRKAINILYNNWRKGEKSYETDYQALYEYSWEKKAEIIYRYLIKLLNYEKDRS